MTESDQEGGRPSLHCIKTPPQPLDESLVRAVVLMQSRFRGWKTRKNILIKSLQYYTEEPPPTRAERNADDDLAPKDAALLLAAQEGDHEKIKRLCSQKLASRAKEPIQDSKGRTPLMRAIQANQTVAALLLLRYHGARVGIKDHQGRSSLSYAIARNNLALILALISSICGLAGDATTEVADSLSTQEVGRLYLLLSNVDALQAGRAAALVFLTDARGAMLIMVRAITAVREKAEVVKNRDTDRAELLFTSARTLEAAVAALLYHAKVLIKPMKKQRGDLGLAFRTAWAQSPRGMLERGFSRIVAASPRRHSSLELRRKASTDDDNDDDTPAEASRKRAEKRRASFVQPKSSKPPSLDATFAVKSASTKTEVSRREGVYAVLSASLSALNVAAKFNCKHLLNNVDIRGYLEDQWNGQLTENERRKTQSVSGVSPNDTKQRDGTGAREGGVNGPVTRKLARRVSLASSGHHGAHANLIEGMESRVNSESRLSHLDASGSMKKVGAEVTKKLEDFWVGAHVEHGKHGRGKVSHFTKDGRMSVDFDNGDTHAYGVASLHKIDIVEDTEDLDSDDTEEVDISVFRYLMCVPSYLVQGLVLWIPLALWQPFATKLKTKAGSWYYLDVPSFKFYSSFISDILFFFSLTALSQPDFSQPHQPLIREFGRRPVVFCHLVWVISILFSELGQFLWSKYAELVELKEALLEVYYTGRPLEAAGNAIALVIDIFTLENLIEFCDLFGPILALVALIDEMNDLDQTYGEGNSLAKGEGGFATRRERREARFSGSDEDEWADELFQSTRVMAYAGGLLLLAWRIMRPMMMVSPTLGTLIHVIDSMLSDVFRWIVIQSILIVGYTSALYALVGDPASTSTGIFPDACEMLSMSDKMTRQGGFRVWLNIFELLIENFLMQEANLSCMRLYAAYPVVTWWLMVTFQLLSAVLMINMLIAMMAKTFEKIQLESAVNFNFLRAQIILTWVERHPSPPPFNLLNIAIGYPVSMLTRLAMHLRNRRKQLREGSIGSQANLIGDALEDAWNETALEAAGFELPEDSLTPGGPTLNSDSINEHFRLVADYHDTHHLRKVSQMFASYITEALASSPAPGVKELKIQLEHSSKEHAKALASIKEELTAKVDKEARAASDQSNALKELLLEQQSTLNALKKMTESSMLGASVGEQVRRRRSKPPPPQNGQASHVLYATHDGKPLPEASALQPVGSMTDHEFQAWMGGQARSGAPRQGTL